MTPLRKRMMEDMTLAGLSANTQRLYSDAVYGLTKHYRRSPDRLSQEQVRAYLLYVKDQKRLAEGTLRICYYGLKFFYLNTLGRPWPFLTMLRTPKKQLPAQHSQPGGGPKTAGPGQEPQASHVPDSHLCLRPQDIRGHQA